MLTPVFLLASLFTGLFSVALFGLACWLLWKCAHPRSRFVEERPGRTAPGRTAPGPTEPDRAPDGPLDRAPAHYQEVPRKDRWREPAVLVPLLAGLALLLLGFGGGRGLVSAFYPRGADEPVPLHGTSRDVVRADGTRIHVEVFGGDDAPTLVLNHGWGTESEELYYAKKSLSGQFRLIVWDLPGLGATEQPAGRDYSLEHMAGDLRLVLGVAGGRPVVLVGHSIGGMINLTFARLYPELLGTQVKGLVQLDTSYTNPVKTTENTDFNQAIQRPVAEPILHVMVALSPLFRAMDWMSFQNGTSQIMNARSAFAGQETRGQLEMVSSFGYRESPGVVARGTLGMFHWDATPVLAQIHIPVLIIIGEKDSTTVPAASEFMHEHIAGSQLAMIPQSRHYALLEQNEQVDAAIAQFAARTLR